MKQARNIIAETLKDKIVPKLPEYKFTVEVWAAFHISRSRWVLETIKKLFLEEYLVLNCLLNIYLR